MIPLPAGEFVGEFHLYCCPGCLTLLQVDVFCPSLGGESVLWDIQPVIEVPAEAPQAAAVGS